MIPIVAVCVSVLLVLGPAGTVFAHSGLTGSLGASEINVDIWSVQCGIGTTQVQARVTDSSGVNDNYVAVTIVNPLGRSVVRVAPDGGTSAMATMASGPGNYLVGVSHSEPIAASYSLFAHCVNGSGAATPHNVLQIQNQ